MDDITRMRRRKSSTAKAGRIVASVLKRTETELRNESRFVLEGARKAARLKDRDTRRKQDRNRRERGALDYGHESGHRLDFEFMELGWEREKLADLQGTIGRLLSGKPLRRKRRK